MTVNYTTLLGLAKPVSGTESGTWGDTVNTNLTDYLDSAVAGAQIISGSLTAVTLSKTTGSSLSQAGTGSTGSSQYQIIRCTGNPASLLTITAPAADKTYIIINATSTSQSVKIVGAGPTTGVTILSGKTSIVAWNGSDFVEVSPNTISGTLPVANGGTGATTLTGVLKGNGTSAFTAASSGTDYSAGTSALATGILKSTTTTGALTIAVAGTDYQTAQSVTGIVKSSGTTRSAATAGTDYVAPGGALGTPSSGTLTNCTFPTLNQNTTGTAAGLSATLAIASGGTNSTATPTAGGVGYGTGTAHAYTTAGTSGQVLTSAGAAVPTWTTPLAGITNTSNTALGVSAFNVSATGVNNSAVGYQALLSNTTGAQNSAFGKDALLNNTTGASNSAVGYQALFSNTTGSYNSASGYAALLNNTTGSYNSAVGYQALNANTIGIQNSAVGYRALYSNTTGNYNSAVGYHALYGNTTGNYNSAFGYYALYTNTTGASNSAFGVQALINNTTGNYNSAVGKDALLNNTTGASNSAVGYNTGGGITTGTGNTIIGAQVTGLAAGLTNNIILANGTGSVRVQSDATTITFADVIKPPQATTAAAPAYVKGGMYFDTTLNKMRIGGATAWETVTSV